MLKEINGVLEFVMIAGDEPITDSQKVAARFSRPHRYVLQRIRELIADLPDTEGLRLFSHTPYVQEQNGQTYDCYQMTKDGFMLLVMGFTGKKALAVKLAFIRAFNAMAEMLRNGLWQRRMEAEAAYLNGKDRASADGKGLRRWRDEKPVRLRVIAELDEQMQFCLPLN